MGADSIKPTSRPQPAHHLDRRFDHRARRSGDARQRSIVEIELDQLDNPVLGADVGRLHGFEEKVLSGMLAIGAGDWQRRLKYRASGRPSRTQGFGCERFVPAR